MRTLLFVNLTLGLSLFTGTLGTASATPLPLPTVASVDLSRYAGAR